ncbi:2087_t:CDS:2 [Entrophospora sp. SA101]|nr:2087_t:CDS:2 [Entrophospora sp. SA101]
MNENNLETKTFSLKVDKLFYEAMGEGKVFEQLATQSYAYFGSTKWQIEEGFTEEKEDKITFTMKTLGKKGIIKGTKDEAHQENKTLWEKTKEKAVNAKAKADKMPMEEGSFSVEDYQNTLIKKHGDIYPLRSAVVKFGGFQLSYN